jgi:hypothetical protein
MDNKVKDKRRGIMNNTRVYRELVELKAKLQKQNELQHTTISALGSLTNVLLHTASSINALNAELKNDAEEVVFPIRPSRLG